MCVLYIMYTKHAIMCMLYYEDLRVCVFYSPPHRGGVGGGKVREIPLITSPILGEE